MKIKNSLLVRGSRPQLDSASATKMWHAEYCGSEMLLLISISVLWSSYSNALKTKIDRPTSIEELFLI